NAGHGTGHVVGIERGKVAALDRRAQVSQEVLDTGAEYRIAEESADRPGVALQQLEHQLIFNEKLEPGAVGVANERLERAGAGADGAQAPADLLRALIEHSPEHRLLVWEVVVERPR